MTVRARIGQSEGIVNIDQLLAPHGPSQLLDLFGAEMSDVRQGLVAHVLAVAKRAA